MPVEGALISPDGETSLIVTEGGWFGAPVDGSEQPQLVFAQLVDPSLRIDGAEPKYVNLPDEPLEMWDLEWISG